MDYPSKYEDKLHKMIEKGLEENSLLANIAASSEAESLKARKAYSLKVDREDITEIMTTVYVNIYKNFQKITKRYSAEININNKNISDFHLKTEEIEKAFKVPQGKIFKVKFITKGFNGVIEFMKKKVGIEEDNNLIKVIFDEGEYKIFFKETFEDFRSILVHPINYYISKSIYTTSKNIKRDKARKKDQSSKLYEGISSDYLELGKGVFKKTKGTYKEEVLVSTLSPENILENEEKELEKEIKKENKDIQIKKTMEKLKEYITTKMKPKRARIYQLYLQYKMNKSFITQEIPNTIKEIASLVGESEGNVKVNFCRANKEIIENLKPDDLKLIFKKEYI